MTYYDAELQRLQHEIARKRQLDAVLDDLHGQRRELTARINALEAAKIKEQSDVDKLEGRSLAAFFYGVIGKMDEKLDKEREEAYAAAVKYDAAAKELSAVEHAIREKETELHPLRDCECLYQQLLHQKKNAIKSAGGAVAEDILRTEERIAYLDEQAKELKEALSAGRAALSVADEVLSSLDSADGWATWDLFGGGLISDMAKHGHLDDAQEAVERLQVQLRRFKSELADVSIQADMQVNIDGFLRFADYFFDGMFADWAVKDRINQSDSQVRQTISQIQTVLGRLENMACSAEDERNETEAKLEQRIREANHL